MAQILIIDDENRFGKMIGHALNGAGLQVAQAADIEEAEAILEGSDFDIASVNTLSG